jgi:hypothetical protein
MKAFAIPFDECYELGVGDNLPRKITSCAHITKTEIATGCISDVG